MADIHSLVEKARKANACPRCTADVIEGLCAEIERLRTDRSGGCACRFDERTLPDGRIDLDAWVHKCAFHAALNAEIERAKTESTAACDAHMETVRRAEAAEAQLAVARSIMMVSAERLNKMADIITNSRTENWGKDEYIWAVAEKLDCLDTLPTRAKHLLDVVTAAGRVDTYEDLSQPAPELPDECNEVRKGLHDALAAYHAEPVAQSGGGTGMGEIAKRTSGPAIE